jgi:hypothetical protein
MKPAMNIPSKTYSVPLDILMDVLRILFENNVPNRVKGISVKDNLIWLDVKLPPDHPYRKDILTNIDGLLGDYQFYLNGTTDEPDFSSYSQNEF